MKNFMIYLARLEEDLSRAGLVRGQLPELFPSGQYWFESQRDKKVISHLHLVFKPKLKVITVHVGWENEFVHQFTTKAIRELWKPGYEWLTRVNVISAPCLLEFNVADHLSWKVGGLDCKTSTSEFQNQLSALIDGFITQKLMAIAEPEKLLDCYLQDERPFHWKNCNSALRVAEIAGLVKLLGVRRNEALNRSREYGRLINTDMFSLGEGSVWIDALFARTL